MNKNQLEFRNNSDGNKSVNQRTSLINPNKTYDNEYKLSNSSIENSSIINTRDEIYHKFSLNLFTKDISRKGMFNAITFVIFSINFTQYSIAEFYKIMGLVPIILIIIITGLCLYFNQSLIIPYIRNIKNKQGTFSAFINKNFGGFASILFDFLVFAWFTFDLFHALLTIVNFIPDLPKSSEYYMIYWVIPMITLIFIVYHNMKCSWISYFNIYFSLLLNSIYVIIAIVFIVLQAIEQPHPSSYFSKFSLRWNIYFTGMDFCVCMRAFSAFSYGLSNTILFFWIVNQYTGISLLSKRYNQMRFIYLFVVLYFCSIGIVNIYLDNLNLFKLTPGQVTDSKDYIIWIWAFRAIYFLQQITQSGYKLFFIRKLIFRNKIRYVLQQNVYYYTFYSIYILLLIGFSLIMQWKGNLTHSEYLLILNGSIGFLLNFIFPMLIYIKFSEKKLGSVRMIAGIINSFIFSIFALSYFYDRNNIEKKKILF